MPFNSKTLINAFFIGSAALLPLINANASDTEIDRVIVFGDSLADGGYYSNLLSLTPSSSFTTNPDPVAPEVFATQLGLSLSSAYGVNASNSNNSNFNSSNYAVGDARVSAANGVSISISGQINNFLAAGGHLGRNDLIYIQGGGNDFFAYQSGGGVNTAIVTNAANELATQVARVQAAGADRIVTLSIQSFGIPGLQLFNNTYDAALRANHVNALYFDADTLFNELIVNASAFGFTSLPNPACTTSSSLLCTPADLVSPDANETHLLADGVHPAGKAQRIQGQAIASLVVAPEQIGQLSYASESLFRSHYTLNQQILAQGFNQDVGSSALFAKAGATEFSTDESLQTVGLEEDSTILNIGIDHRLAAETSVGVALSVSDGEGEFYANRGDYNVDAASILIYAQGDAGSVHLHSDFMYGRVNYENLTREVQLGPVMRQHEGDTDGNFVGVDISASMEFVLVDTLSLVPKVGLNWHSLSIDDYAEEGTLSTGASFGKQELRSLTGVLGLSFRNSVASRIHFYVDGQFNYELNDEDRNLTMTPNGAPISYKSELSQADKEYVSLDAGIYVRVAGSALLQLGVQGVRGREGMDSTMGYIGTVLEF